MFGEDQSMAGGEKADGPSEIDREIIEDFFKEHCRNSKNRLGRLDVDCWSVTRRLVTFLTEIDDHGPSQPPRRVRWIIQKPMMLREPKRWHPIKRRIVRIFHRRLHPGDHVSENKKSRQKHHRAISNYHLTPAIADAQEISHWVVEWKGFIIDATVMQFVELDNVLDDHGTDELRKRCYSNDEMMTFKSCSDIHPTWVHELLSRGSLYREYEQGVASTPYFFGRESEHPVRCHAEVVNVPIK